MDGRTKDLSSQCSNRDDYRSILTKVLFVRFKYLINELSVGLAFKEVNYSRRSYEEVGFAMSEAIRLKQDISEFLGLLYYLEKYHRELLWPYREQVEKIKAKIFSLP